MWPDMLSVQTFRNRVDAQNKGVIIVRIHIAFFHRRENKSYWNISEPFWKPAFKMTIMYYLYRINDTTLSLFLGQMQFLSTWIPYFFFFFLFCVTLEIWNVCAAVRSVKKLLFLLVMCYLKFYCRTSTSHVSFVCPHCIQLGPLSKKQKYLLHVKTLLMYRNDYRLRK